MDKKKLAELKKKSKSLSPVVRIGKNGISENQLKEIITLLKKRKLIKIKVLKNSSLDTDEVIAEVINKCECTLIDKIGMTFSVYRGKSL